MSDTDKLLLYGYYKQVTKGDNPKGASLIGITEAGRKNNAWANVKGMSPKEAEAKYIALVEKLSH